MDKWLPISKAPKDGTMILVTETPNGEAWNVIPACWMALTSQEQSDKEFFENGGLPPNNSHKGSWWGICDYYWVVILRSQKIPYPIAHPIIVIKAVGGEFVLHDGLEKDHYTQDLNR